MTSNDDRCDGCIWYGIRDAMVSRDEVHDEWCDKHREWNPTKCEDYDDGSKE